MTSAEEARRVETALAIAAIKAALPPALRQIVDIPTSLKIVDVGANPIDGPAPYKSLLDSPRTQVVGFEPNLDALAVLNAKKGPRETYLAHAIADGRRHTLRHCALPGMTSLLEPNPAILSLFYGFKEWAAVVRSEEIDTMRLDDVPETAGLDLLKIDIQGAELMAFENATERLKTGSVIHTEVEFLPMYVGQPLFSEVEKFLRGHGYILHKFAPLVSRDLMPLLLSADPYVGHSQIFWADAVFVKDFTRLDLLSTDQLLRMSEILYDCYGSYDVVLRLLREHDQRTGLGFGKKYAEFVRPLRNSP